MSEIRKCELCDTYLEKIQTGRGHINLLPEEVILGHGPAEECQACFKVYCSACYPDRPNVCLCGLRRLKLIKVRYHSRAIQIEPADQTNGHAGEEALPSDWALLLRRFLTDQDADLLRRAVEVLERQTSSPSPAPRPTIFRRWLQQAAGVADLDARVLALLKAWQAMDFPTVFKKGPPAVRALTACGRVAEAKTVAMLYDEILIQTAEGYMALPEEVRLQRFQTGLEACMACAGSAEELSDYPLTAKYLVRLGNGLYSARRLPESTAAFEKASELWRTLAAKQPHRYLPELARTLNHLGTSASESHGYVHAWAYYDEAITILRGLTRLYPQLYLLESAQVLNNIAGLYVATGQLDTALDTFGESIPLWEKLAAGESIATYLNALAGRGDAGPTAISMRMPYEVDLARALCNRGDALCDLNRCVEDLHEARVTLERAVKIQERWLMVLPSANVCLFLANSLAALGRVLYQLGSQERDEQTDYFTVARRELEKALALQLRNFVPQIPAFVVNLVNTLINLGVLYLKASELGESKRVLTEAVEMCERHQLWRLLARALAERAALEVKESGQPLAGVAFDERAIKALEKGLVQLNEFERSNRDLFKGPIEVSYAKCIAHYMQQHEPARVFQLLESLRQVDRLSGMARDDLKPVVDLSAARAFVAQEKIAYLAVQVVPAGAVFFSLLPSGEVVYCSIGVGWRARFFALFELINRAVREAAAPGASGAPLSELDDLGGELFNMLPAEVRALLTSHVGNIFLSPQGDLQNLPFEFLRLPSGEYLGLRQLLPRVHSFAELQSVVHRQPGLRSRSCMVVGDPRDDLPHARAAAESVATKLRARQLNIEPDKGLLCGQAVTKWKLLDALDAGIMFGLYCGHGGYDKEGGFLALSGGEVVRPKHIAHLWLADNPIIHYDCCQAGITVYHLGGHYAGLAPFTVAIGASCCLLANRLIYDKLAARMTSGLYDKLLGGLTVGESLLETRRQIAEGSPNPLYWAFPIMYGNPGARLVH
jgi:tetratricopeptide (TPR) repeat protein